MSMRVCFKALPSGKPIGQAINLTTWQGNNLSTCQPTGRCGDRPTKLPQANPKTWKRTNQPDLSTNKTNWTSRNSSQTSLAKTPNYTASPTRNTPHHTSQQATRPHNTVVVNGAHNDSLPNGFPRHADVRTQITMRTQTHT